MYLCHSCLSFPYLPSESVFNNQWPSQNTNDYYQTWSALQQPCSACWINFHPSISFFLPSVINNYIDTLYSFSLLNHWSSEWLDNMSAWAPVPVARLSRDLSAAGSKDIKIITLSYIPRQDCSPRHHLIPQQVQGLGFLLLLLFGFSDRGSESI